MAEYVETIIIGGGQAGLAMSYHLSQLGRDHVILERGRVAERWRSERWDSLTFQFPNWMLGLPGYAYEGNEPDRFMPRDGLVGFIEEYARRIEAPLRCGIRVTALRQSKETESLVVETAPYTLEATNVVVATGPYQEPSIPPFSASLPSTVYQITANRYTNPNALPPGGVLVVGSGASGYQITEDIMHSGRDVYLSVGRHRRVPRQYRGKDFGWWADTMGFWERTAENAPQGAGVLTGVNGGHDVDFRRLTQAGVTLVGSLQSIDGKHLSFAPDLEENLKKGDKNIDDFKRLADAYVVKHNIVIPEEPPSAPLPAMNVSSIKHIDIEHAGITSIIWATGYRYDFSWVQCPVIDANGAPIQRRGETSVPGLYFLGLSYLYTFRSAFLRGVGEDAAYLAECISIRM